MNARWERVTALFGTGGGRARVRQQQFIHRGQAAEPLVAAVLQLQIADRDIQPGGVQAAGRMNLHREVHQLDLGFGEAGDLRRLRFAIGLDECLLLLVH